jgi:Holliday junction resolvase RusA-like endonuclease
MSKNTNNIGRSDPRMAFPTYGSPMEVNKNYMRSAFVDPNEGYRLTLPVPPSINRKFISRTFVVSPEYRRFKEFVAAKMIKMRLSPLKGPVSLTILWYRARKAGDIDMFEKVLMDSLQGEKFGCYLNDKQVVEKYIRKTDEDPYNPRIEVTVKPL